MAKSPEATSMTYQAISKAAPVTNAGKFSRLRHQRCDPNRLIGSIGDDQSQQYAGPLGLPQHRCADGRAVAAEAAERHEGRNQTTPWSVPSPFASVHLIEQSPCQSIVVWWLHR
jgi:hypothetical protein